MRNLGRVVAALTGLTLAACSQPGPTNGSPREISPTTDPLTGLIASLPAPDQAAIRGDTPHFLSLLARTLADDPDLIRLVDKQHYLDASYQPTDLVNLDTLGGPLVKNKPGLELRRPAAEALLRMAVAARAAGITLDVSSCYRSYAVQEAVFAHNVRELGQTQAERESAKPGSSQHQLGTAVDFGSITPAFANTKAGQWLADHAWRYGFSLSYPAGYEPFTGYLYESWHYRYVGPAAAELIRRYFSDIQQQALVFMHDHQLELRRLLNLLPQS